MCGDSLRAPTACLWRSTKRASVTSAGEASRNPRPKFQPPGLCFAHLHQPDRLPKKTFLLFRKLVDRR
jgi:hypothetical protein